MNRIQRLLAAILLIFAASANAGQSCSEKPVSPEAVTQALALAQQVQAYLESQQAQTVVLARVGSDISKHGLRYTHAALAYRDLTDGHWIVYHKLDHCGQDEASLFRQGLANFWLDDPLEYRALVLIPAPGLQKTLLEAVNQQAGPAVHQKHYSLIAYPYETAQQNSNGWLLEMIAVAQGAQANREQAQQWLRSNGYQPSRINIAPHERLGAALFRANVSFLDHPLKDRLRGRYSIVSVESIASYLGQRGDLLAQRELTVQ